MNGLRKAFSLFIDKYFAYVLFKYIIKYAFL